MLHLVTAANGAEKFYGDATNATRHETAAQARELDDKIIKQWSKHPALKVRACACVRFVNNGCV